ncbi:MAG TPA: hypothetical protein VK844_03355 [Hyphomicrobiales bacterium]|nr:hypothetical protein [Hyphomicrobiales bacterium]
MTDTSMPEALQRMAEAGRISAEDVLTLRRQVFTDGVVQPREAEWLFALNDACKDSAPEWPEFFVEALVDYTVHQAEPHGYVSPENGKWLVDRISRSGVANSTTELELLLKVLEQSRQSPDSLVGFALAQVKVAAVEGSGPVRSGASLQPGRIGKAETELLRRILYAAGGDGNIAVTRTEAGLLFDINDATREAENDPDWADLFAKAIANHLLAGHGHDVPPREVALARAKWLDEPSGGFFKSLTSGLSGIWRAYRQPDVWEKRIERQEAAIRSAARLTSDEARWLADRLGRYGGLRDHERALVEFLAEESSDVDANLRPLMDKVPAG